MNVDPRFHPAAGRQRVFNLPPVLVALIVLLVALHMLRAHVLSAEAAADMLFALAFIPIREVDPDIAASLPGGSGARIWSFASYALLHGDWAHLVFNLLWLAAFGSAVPWRFGPLRFLGYSLVGAVAGAAVHLALFPRGLTPLVGASAAISAHMAGASRFALSGRRPLIGAAIGPAAYRVPAPPLSVTMRDRRVLVFLGVWFGLNLLFGLFGGDGALASGAIAWEAHIGGFVAGLFFFSIFDPVAVHR